LIQQIAFPWGLIIFLSINLAGFNGSPVMNFIPCHVLSKDGRLLIDAEAFQLPVPEKKVPYYQPLTGSEAIFGIRPNDIYDRLYAPEHLRTNVLRAIVDVIEPLGSEIHLNVTAGKHNLVGVVDTQTIIRMHQEIELALDLDKMHLFEKNDPNLRVKTEL
jgi:multiple sugar transport system ATP-binding protein